MTAHTITDAVSPRVSQRLFRTRPEDALPYVATHHRVYIVPSKRGFALLFALLLMLVASINYALSLGYALSFLLTGLFAASLLHTYKNLVGIEVHSVTPEHGFSGDTVAFHIALHNSAVKAREGLCVSTQHGDTPVITVAPGGSGTAVLRVNAANRGRLTLGRLTIKSNWPLDLWTCWSYLHAPGEALVYPAPEPDPPPMPSQHTGDAGDQRAPALDGEIAGVREYRPGDSLSAIAWKNAAKGAGLHVRTFEQDTHQRAATLSLHATGHHNLEHQLSRLSAWVIQAQACNTEYALELPGTPLERNSGAAHHQAALQRLALYGQSS